MLTTETNTPDGAKFDRTQKNWESIFIDVQGCFIPTNSKTETTPTEYSFVRPATIFAIDGPVGAGGRGGFGGGGCGGGGLGGM
jgi:hypothetical protein